MKAIYPFSTFIVIVITLLFSACTPDVESADLVILNGKILTLAEQGEPYVEALAAKNGRIIALGKNDLIKQHIKDDATRILDLEGKFAMPGFIEGHGHFSGLGFSLMNLNFLAAKNWDEIVGKVEARTKELKPGEWIEGRGWHQEKWNKSPEQQIHGYPFHHELSALTPDHPVILFHASGHSLYANEKAMEIANITKETPDPAGGTIIRDNTGEAIGVFEERAMTPIRDAFNAYQETLSEKDRFERWQKAITLAEANCLENGITSFQDAGSSFDDVKNYKELATKKELDLRLWSMLRHPYDEMVGKLDGFSYTSDFFTCRAIKSQVDGALGAFGAWLLKPYHDKPGFEGQNTTPVSEVKNIAQLALKHNMQLCVHAIGDRANRVTLNIYEEAFGDKAQDNDLRWRIEHAQHLDVADIPRFKSLGVIASMQGVHCTSDAPFVEKRLGEERARKGAYAWRSLIDNGVYIANGTDAPVEDVSALESLYASVTRKRTDTGLEFFTEQKMTREEALKSYTTWNAFAAFEEKDKGTLELGKFADIVVLSKNLMKCSDEDILNADIIYTIVGGEIKYANVK